MDESGILVEMGSWGVDRTRALEVIRRYQYEDMFRFVSPLARCAVLSGASELHFVLSAFGFEVWFDGRPFSPDTLADPYRALFSDSDEEGRRDRQLAVGLLTAARTEPREVTISSGAGDARRTRSLKAGPPPASPPRRGTEGWNALRFTWGPLDGWLIPAECFERVMEDCRYPPIRIEVAGKAVPRRPIPIGRKPWESEEEGIRLQAARVRAGVEPSVSLYAQGVKVCEVPWPEPAPEVEAHADNGLFTLNIGQSGVVQDEQWSRTLGKLRALSEKALAAGAARPTLWRFVAALTALGTGAFAWYLWERIRLGDAPDPDYARLRLPLYAAAMGLACVIGAVLSVRRVWERVGDRPTATFSSLSVAAMAAMSFFLGTEFLSVMPYILAALILAAIIVVAWLRTPPEKD